MTLKMEYVMKVQTIILTCGLLAFNTTLLANTANTTTWSAKSSEIQFDKQSVVFEKSSAPAKSAAGLDGQATQSKKPLAAEYKTDSINNKTIQKQTARSLSARPQVQNLDHEFWIYDAVVTLYSDADYDGYYHHFSVEFDADTIFEHADVYARLYLSSGDVFQEYHTTSVFHIDGESELDSFEVDSELLSGFPTDDYEVLIELYDAFSDELVATLDGNDDADLYFLSLESEDFEVVYVEPQVVIVRESGGSFGYLSLLLIPFFWFRKFTTK
ncbi:MAG: hypothetical protein ACI808_001180 [Paraglaciecola sp.]|jgi:hypothetical protein